MGTIKKAGSSGKSLLLSALILLAIGSACNSARATWLTDFEGALKQASDENKYVVLDLSASW